MRILFTGTRRMRSDWLIRRALSELPHTEFQEWVHGAGPGEDGAPGCDELVDRLALENDVALRRVPAKWTELGHSAGPIRNSEMVKFGADICLAFPDKFSRGTWDCLRKAVAAGIPTRIYPVMQV